MKKVVFIIAAALLYMASPYPVNAQEVQFWESIADMPLMPGLKEQPGEALVFDKPDGRYVEASAFIKDPLNEADVINYYNDSLPQFGWSPEAPLEYRRNNEILKISFEREETNHTIILTIIPVNW